MDPAIEIIAQIINFAIFLFLLNWILVKPVRGMMAKRREEADAQLNEAKEKEATAEKLRAEAEKKAEELEKKRDEVLSAAREQAETQRKELIQRTEEEGRSRLERFRRLMEEEREDLLSEVNDDLRKTIAATASTLLKDAGVALTDRGIERLEALLAEMPEGERAGAKKALQGEDTRIRVRAADELTDEQQDRVAELIARALGIERRTLEVERDESLLAGLEVALGHVNVVAHWKGMIDAQLRGRDRKFRGGAEGSDAGPQDAGGEGQE